MANTESKNLTINNIILGLTIVSMFYIFIYCIYCFIDLSLLSVIENVNIIKEQRKEVVTAITNNTTELVDLIKKFNNITMQLQLEYNKVISIDNKLNIK